MVSVRMSRREPTMDTKSAARTRGRAGPAGQPALPGRRPLFRPRGERGQSLVELAFVVPLLLVLVCAVAEFGFMISDEITLVHAAHDGARAGSAPGCNLDTTCETSAATAQANQTVGGTTSCGSPTASVPSVGGTPQQITVKVSCTYTPVTPLGGLISLIGGSFGASIPLQATTTMRVSQ